jgi:hypothetical protein
MVESEGVAVELTDQERAYLSLYQVITYAIEIPLDLARQMAAKGLVEWMPPILGTRMYAITQKGRDALKENIRKNPT